MKHPVDLKLVVRGFLRVLRFSSRSSSVTGSADITAEINAILTLSNLKADLSPKHTLKWTRVQSCANHMQRIERLSCAKCRVAMWYGGTAGLLCLTEIKSHLL